MLKKIIFLIVASLLCFSCSDELSRSEAKEQIIQSISNNKIKDSCNFKVRKQWKSNYSSSGFCTVTFTNPPQGEERNMINHFIDKGLLKINQETIYRDCAQWKLNNLEILEKAKEFLVDEDDNHYLLNSASFDIGEIVGIKQNEQATNAIAEYNIKRVKTTPFADFWETNCFDTKKVYKATFEKYDDGWRIK